MFCLNYKKIISIAIFPVIIAIGFIPSVVAAFSTSSLSGRILLQVESHGEAWYVNPLDLKRYYLGRPDDAFNILRSFGLGISEKDFSSFGSNAPSRLAGRILLRVERSGEAYYVDPVKLNLLYLGRPSDAFEILRSRGLGISNADLTKIVSAELLNSQPVEQSKRSFSFEYRGKQFKFLLDLNDSYFKYYSGLPKVAYYYGSQDEAAVRENFYALFFQVKSGDGTMALVASQLRSFASVNGFDDNYLAEMALSFVQSIPYDKDKAAKSSFTANMPYETLYLDKGVCSEKVFLGAAILRQLGFGSAILDFPDKNHSALGIACPYNVSSGGSGYCYGETTTRLPFYAVPSSLSSGQANSETYSWQSVGDVSRLGKMEIYQKSTGRQYDPTATISLAASLYSLDQAVEDGKSLVSSEETVLSGLEATLSQKKSDADYYLNQGDYYNYKAAIAEYNRLVVDFNDKLANYNDDIASYNRTADQYNEEVKAFYWHL